MLAESNDVGRYTPLEYGPTLTNYERSIQEDLVAWSMATGPSFQFYSLVAFRALARLKLSDRLDLNWRVLRIDTGRSANGNMRTYSVSSEYTSETDSDYVPSTDTSSGSIPSLVWSSSTANGNAIERPRTPHPSVGLVDPVLPVAGLAHVVETLTDSESD